MHAFNTPTTGWLVVCAVLLLCAALVAALDVAYRAVAIWSIRRSLRTLDQRARTAGTGSESLAGRTATLVLVARPEIDDLEPFDDFMGYSEYDGTKH